jgi:predicted  nucleic acid-binding Zn-ribbon protein
VDRPPALSHPPVEVSTPPAGSVALRIWDAAKTLITISEQLKALEKEDGRIQTQILELGRAMLGLVKDVHEMSGQLKSIEKRLDDKDKMLEAVIKLKIIEEFQKIRM